MCHSVTALLRQQGLSAVRCSRCHPLQGTKECCTKCCCSRHMCQPSWDLGLSVLRVFPTSQAGFAASAKHSVARASTGGWWTQLKPAMRVPCNASAAGDYSLKVYSGCSPRLGWKGGWLLLLLSWWEPRGWRELPCSLPWAHCFFFFPLQGNQPWSWFLPTQTKPPCVPMVAEQPTGQILCSQPSTWGSLAHTARLLAQGNTMGYLHVGRLDGLEDTGLSSTASVAGAQDINAGKEMSYKRMQAVHSNLP